jgi:hypothetical protein
MVDDAGMAAVQGAEEMDDVGVVAGELGPRDSASLPK